MSYRRLARPARSGGERGSCSVRRARLEPLERRELLVSSLTANDVLVLYNSASAASTQIANYYASAHPGVHLAGVTGVNPNVEWISADDYLSIIRPQVLAALTPSIDVIVTTKGLPLRITVTETAPTAPFPLVPTYVDSSGVVRSILNWKPYSSLESELTSVRTVGNWQMMGDQSWSISNHFTINPYYGDTVDFNSAANGNMLLTSRLDGYTVNDVLASIDRAQMATLSPSGSPTPGFLVDNDPTVTYAPSMANLVSSVLTPAGVPVVYDNTTAFVGTAPGSVIGYTSHGTRQSSTPANYVTTGLNLNLAPGAVFNSWESYNAYSFTPGGYSGTQGQVAQWLAIGGTAGIGNVQEPGASIASVANEDKLFAMLLSGKTWVEAAWSSLAQLSYVNTVIGDPLMTWRPPVANIAVPTTIVRGVTANFTLSASNPGSTTSSPMFSFVVNWGDGTSPQMYVGLSGMQVTHTYDIAGTWTISVTAMDNTGRVSGPTTKAVSIRVAQLTASTDQPGLLDLSWTGSDGEDQARFEQLADGTIRVTETKYNGAATNTAQIFTGVTGRLIAKGKNGNDRLDASGLENPATIDGGAGNNTLFGGNGGDVLIGGSNGGEGQQGNNVIIAGNGENVIFGNAIYGLVGSTGGNNLIVGGTGNDRIYGNFGVVRKSNGDLSNGGEGGQNLIIGNGGDDEIHAYMYMDGAEGGHGSILVAGSTTLNQAALQSILAEWTSTHTLSDKLFNIQGSGNGSGLNGSNYLIPGLTLLGDDNSEYLYGDTDGGVNWLFADPLEDLETQLKPEDKLTNLW